MGKRGIRRSPVQNRLLKKFNEACYYGELTTVLQLIDKVNINKKDEDGWNSLTHLCSGIYRDSDVSRPTEDDYTMAIVLLAYGVDIDAKAPTLDGRSLTALESISEKHPEFANKIKDHVYWNRGEGIKGCSE